MLPGEKKRKRDRTLIVRCCRERDTRTSNDIVALKCDKSLPMSVWMLCRGLRHVRVLLYMKSAGMRNWILHRDQEYLTRSTSQVARKVLKKLPIQGGVNGMPLIIEQNTSQIMK